MASTSKEPIWLREITYRFDKEDEMDVKQMRRYLADKYGSEWVAKKSDQEVIAIYYSMQRRKGA